MRLSRFATSCSILIAFAASVFAAVPAADAAASCGYVPTPVFAPWGDTNPYAPFQGSSFESGASGWSWTNKASIISGDNGLITPGTHAVEIPGTGAAKSPWTCVDSTTPSLRFVVRRVSGSGKLTVNGIVSGAGGQATTMIAFAGSSVWQPSPIVTFPQGFVTTGTAQAQFTFTSDANTVYRIDDVYIDPIKCC
jgi:hypothetical protein